MIEYFIVLKYPKFQRSTARKEKKNLYATIIVYLQNASFVIFSSFIGHLLNLKSMLTVPRNLILVPFRFEIDINSNLHKLIVEWIIIQFFIYFLLIIKGTVTSDVFISFLKPYVYFIFSNWWFVQHDALFAHLKLIKL